MKTSKTLNSLILGSLFAYGAAAQAAEPIDLAPVQSLRIQSSERTIMTLLSGLSIYTFKNDEGSGGSVCTATCAEKWPPVIVEAQDIVGDPRLGIIERANGLSQLTVDGKPVYTFFLDRKVGDIKGHNLGNVWHLIML